MLFFFRSYHFHIKILKIKTKRIKIKQSTFSKLHVFLCDSKSNKKMLLIKRVIDIDILTY